MSAGEVSDRSATAAASDPEARREEPRPSALRKGEPGPEDHNRSKAYLHAGHLFVSSSPTAVTTILGSCVAVSLWDPESRVGGLNHYLLPYWVGNGLSSPRFGSVAVTRLIDDVIALGGSPRRLQAKLFGGACILSASDGKKGHLGEQNLAVARDLLGERGIPIVAQAVGGQRGRKVIFHTDEGVAWVKAL